MKRVFTCPRCEREQIHYARELCRRCYARVYADPLYKARHRERLLAKSKEYYQRNRAQHNQYGRNARLRIRLEMLQAYGGKCACCGETELVFLTLDHVEGGGRKHQRELGGSSDDTARYLKSLGWPRDGYQILCFNCNYAKYRLGVCPHQAARVSNP